MPAEKKHQRKDIKNTKKPVNKTSHDMVAVILKDIIHMMVFDSV
jgi:hypothetical protein